MTCLHSINVYAVTLICLTFIVPPVPVNSIKYKADFDPVKPFHPCKDTKYDNIRKHFDFSKLSMTLSKDNELLLQGTVSLMKQYPPDQLVTVCHGNNFEFFVIDFFYSYRCKQLANRK